MHVIHKDKQNNQQIWLDLSKTGVPSSHSHCLNYLTNSITMKSSSNSVSKSKDSLAWDISTTKILIYRLEKLTATLQERWVKNRIQHSEIRKSKTVLEAEIKSFKEIVFAQCTRKQTIVLQSLTKGLENSLQLHKHHQHILFSQNDTGYWCFTGLSQRSSSAPQFHALFGCIPAYSH